MLAWFLIGCAGLLIICAGIWIMERKKCAKRVCPKCGMVYLSATGKIDWTCECGAKIPKELNEWF